MTPEERIRRALPFPGTIYQGSFQRNDFTYGVALFQRGYLDQAAASFQQVIATGQPYLGMPIVSRLTGRPTLPYAVPLRDDSGVLRGVLVGGISLAVLSETVINIQPDASAPAKTN